MPLALPQPVVLATSVASYLVAPAAGKRVTAWIDYPAARASSPDAAARRRGNRLVIAARGGGRAQVVYDGGCDAAQRCDTAGAPVAGADTVLYAVADGRHIDLAAATLRRRPSRLVAQMPPAADLPPYALAGDEAIWYAGGELRKRPPELTSRAQALVAAPLAGAVIAVVRQAPVTAWLATTGGQDVVYEQVDGGRAKALYRETRPGERLTALAALDGGRVAVVAVRTAGAARTAGALLITPGVAVPQSLAASVPSPAGLAYSPAISAYGGSVAFRRRVGSDRGLLDQIVVVNVGRGTTRVVASAPLRTMRLSDPSLGYGRVVWSAAEIAGRKLVRSRVLATPA